MSLEKRSCSCEVYFLHRTGLFLYVLTLGLFIGIEYLGRGIKTNLWAGVSYSMIIISNFFVCVTSSVSLLFANRLTPISISAGSKRFILKQIVNPVVYLL
jgi:hypothetical protein